MKSRSDILEIIQEMGSVATMAELRAKGVTTPTIRQLVRSGELDNPAWGVYRIPGCEESVYAEWAVVARKYPDAVVCLLSAATFHGMTQELHGNLTVAVSREMGGKPSMGNNFMLGIDTLIWRSQDMLTLSVDRHQIDGTPVKITSPERTLVDLFRYSSFNSAMKDSSVRITDEMFLECLNRCSSDYMEHFSFDTVAAIARTLKCYDAIRPYTKTLRYVKSEVPSY